MPYLMYHCPMCGQTFKMIGPLNAVTTACTVCAERGVISNAHLGCDGTPCILAKTGGHGKPTLRIHRESWDDVTRLSARLVVLRKYLTITVMPLWLATMITLALGSGKVIDMMVPVYFAAVFMVALLAWMIWYIPIGRQHHRAVIKALLGAAQLQEEDRRGKENK